MPNTYLQGLRNQAMSILAGVQRLEDLQATEDDEFFASVNASLDTADSDVWSTVDWISGGREE